MIQNRLTALSPAGGCGCKMGSQELHEVLAVLRPPIGATSDFTTMSDCAVLPLGDDDSLLLTNDFFTPIVDDPFTWGRIAAANALSDIYAMGASPWAALSIVGWPIEELGVTGLQQVLAGASSVLAVEEVSLVGGHSILDEVPKFGLTVLGRAPTRQLMFNHAARRQDILILSKPIGVGIIATAIKHDHIMAEDVSDAIAGMERTNAATSHVAVRAALRAATDVTGFGLIGHLSEMLVASNVSATLFVSEIPVYAAARDLATRGVTTSGGSRNQQSFAHFIDNIDSIEPEMRALLFDPQTSGGLLLACPPDKAEGLIRELSTMNVRGSVIGEVTSSRDTPTITLA
jgi:selenide,water dikinase